MSQHAAANEGSANLAWSALGQRGCPVGRRRELEALDAALQPLTGGRERELPFGVCVDALDDHVNASPFTTGPRA